MRVMILMFDGRGVVVWIVLLFRQRWVRKGGVFCMIILFDV